MPPSQIQTSAPEVSTTTYTAAVDSAVDELNDRDHNEFISEVAATDRGLQTEQNQQSSFSTQDVSSRSRNKKEKQKKRIQLHKLFGTLINTILNILRKASP